MKRKEKVLILICVLCAATMTSILAVLAEDSVIEPEGAITEHWIARYNGPANLDDVAYTLAVDDSGNVYVTGPSDFIYPSGTSSDYATVKYDTNGDEMWVARYNGPGNGPDVACSVVVDDSGNVYVTGYSYNSVTSYDYATIKYDPDGIQQWVARYNGPANGNDQAYEVAVDNAGYVYVTGESYGAGTSSDYATVKYDKDGNQLWEARYNGPGNGRDVVWSLAVDDLGNVYVTGESYGAGTSSDYATVKYDTDGNELWVARYNGGNFDRGIALTLDSYKNVYVTGYVYLGFLNGDICTVKYDKDGNQLWETRYNGPENRIDAPYDLAVDCSGNVYVTGQSYGVGTSYDIVTIKYGTDGNQLWAARYNGPGNGNDEAYVVVIDNLGSVYTVGTVYGSGTSLDYATIKYDTDGNEMWVARYNGPGNGDDRAIAVAVDGFGDVYITGLSVGSETSYDFATIKYGPSPEELTQILIEEIKTWNLNKGTENSLITKLESALHLSSIGNANGAIQKLTDFIMLVEALEDKKLTLEQSTHLIAEAKRIINIIQG